jgi:hypothetical protein
MKTITAFLCGLCLLLGGLRPAAQAQSCPAPVLTGITSPTPGTLVVNFTPVATATGYVVRYFWAGDSTATGLRRFYTSSSPATLTGLQTPAYYVVSVGSICSPGDTVYSGTQFVYTGSPAQPCATVSNVQVSNITSTTAAVSFIPTGSATSYLVRYFIAGTALYNSVTTSNSAVTLSGLQPNTSYIVQVSAYCSSGTQSGWATSAFQTSASTPPPAPCGAVTNVTVTATSDSTALVSFTPGANNTSFIIRYHVANDSARWVTTTSSPAIIAGLIPGRTYYVQVTSLCGSSSGTAYSSSPAITFGFRGTSALSTRRGLGAGLIELYPNPARQTVQLDIPAVTGASSARVSVLNGLGQEVRTRQVALTGARNRTQLELTGLKPGLYTVRISAGGQSASQRLVVEP